MTNFHEKLRALRVARKLTQSEVADYLHVSAQSVSKWERGLLSPDIQLLPKLAVLYQTSLDSLFDMEQRLGEQRKAEFRAQIKILRDCGDHEGIFRAYIAEIERMPDHFSYYADVMRCVFRAGLSDDEHVEPLVQLADYADAHCAHDDIRNEIHRLMLQICHSSGNESYRKRIKRYYMQLSMLRHSREIYAMLVMDGEEYREQLRNNILYCVDVAECAIRQMVTPTMSREEKLFYYQTAAALYEVVLNGRFGGIYDGALLSDYAKLIRSYAEMGQTEQADDCMRKALAVLARYADPRKQVEASPLVPRMNPEHAPSPDTLCLQWIRGMMDRAEAVDYREALCEIEALIRTRLDETDGTTNG